MASEASPGLYANELMDRPDFIEGSLAYDALRAVSKAANDEVASFRRQTIDYREYVETWVHEAKSPLAAAHLMLENIEDELSAVGEEPLNEELLLARVRSLDEELDRMEGYVEQALFYARIRSGGARLPYTRIQPQRPGFRRHTGQLPHPYLGPRGASSPRP